MARQAAALLKILTAVAMLNLFCGAEPTHKHQGRQSLESQGNRRVGLCRDLMAYPAMGAIVKLDVASAHVPPVVILRGY